MLNSCTIIIVTDALKSQILWPWSSILLSSFFSFISHCLIMSPLVVVVTVAVIAVICPQERYRSIVMNMSVCLSVCVWDYLSVCKAISTTTHAIFTNFSVHVAYGCGSVLLGQSNEIPKGRGSFGWFSSTLYSVAFGTHTKTAEPIEMPLGTMTRVGRTYHC